MKSRWVREGGVEPPEASLVVRQLLTCLTVLGLVKCGVRDHCESTTSSSAGRAMCNLP